MKNLKKFKVKTAPSSSWARLEKRLSAPWWVKLFRIALLSITISLFASCEAEEIPEPATSQIHVSHDPVPQFLIGTYQSESKDIITITPETITIGSDIYFLPAYRTIDNKWCWYSLYLENGTEIRLEYFRLKHGYITFNDIKYYTYGKHIRK